LELGRIAANLAKDLAALHRAGPSAELYEYQEQWQRAIRLRLKLEDRLCEAQVYLARRLVSEQQEEVEDLKP